MQDDLIRFVGACCMQLVEENNQLKKRVEKLEGRLWSRVQRGKKRLFPVIGTKKD